MKKQNLRKIIRETIKGLMSEQYDGISGAGSSTLSNALGNFGMSYCSCNDPSTSPLRPYDNEVDCISNVDGFGNTCIWNSYSSDTTGTTSNWDQAKYFAWADTFFGYLFAIYKKSNWSVDKVCIWLQNRFDHQFGKFLTAGNKWKSQLAAKLYHIFHLMQAWGCGAPLQEGRKDEWMSYVPAVAKPIIEGEVQNQLQKLKKLSGEDRNQLGENTHLNEQDTSLPQYSNYVCVGNQNSPACQFITGGGLNAWENGYSGLGMKILQWNDSKDDGNCVAGSSTPSCPGTCKALSGRRWRLKRKLNASGAHSGGTPAGGTWTDMINYKINFIDGKMANFSC